MDRRALLVAVARSRDVETDFDTELASARSELRRLDEPVPSLVEARRRVAETEADLDVKRESVATLRGRVQETDDGDISAAYRRAIRELSEAETEHAAAREQLRKARREARSARDDRERRLKIQDRIRNLERRRRRELVDGIRPQVDEAVASVPESGTDEFVEAAPVTAALAAVHVGVVEVPVVVACRRFESRGDAETWLGAPVVWL